MLEISIICVIALAGAYWMALFLMGRREDVLHGDFIKGARSPAPKQAQRTALPPPLLDLRRPMPAQATPPDPVKPPEPARPAVPLKRVEPAVLIKTVDPVRPAQPAESIQPAVKPIRAAEQHAEIGRLPGPARPARAASPPAWRRSQAPAPAQPDTLQSLLETIKRDLGDAVSR